MTTRTALWKIGKLQFEPLRGRLRQTGESEWVPLDNQDAKVLAFLVENYNGKYSNDKIVQEVWDNTPVETDSLYKSISNLRRRLGGERKEYIISKPYRLIVEPELIDPVNSSAEEEARLEATAPREGDGPAHINRVQRGRLRDEGIVRDTYDQLLPAAKFGSDLVFQPNPEIAEFLFHHHLALDPIDGYIELESDEAGWTHDVVEFRNLGPYKPSAAFASLIERFKADPPIKGYYSFFDVESRTRDEERKLIVYALEGGWRHIYARNEVEKHLHVDPECRRFKIECENEFMPGSNSRVYRQVNCECIVVSSDNSIVLGRRRIKTRDGHAVPFFPGAWSATLEEQMLRLDPTGETPPDKDLFAGAERGVVEELNVRVMSEDIRLLSYGVEWGNYTGAFLFLVKTIEDFETIAKRWTQAKDRNEAIALDFIPGDIQSIADALSKTEYAPSPRVKTWRGPDAIARDVWHPTARARLLAYLRHLQYLDSKNAPAVPPSAPQSA